MIALTRREIGATGLVAACVGLASPAFAGEPRSEFDMLFKDWKSPNSPGGSIAIWQGSSLVYKSELGFASIENRVPIASKSRFLIASITKQFTAFAIARLFHEGLASPSDDVHKFIPELPDFGSSITFSHLLHHTSGLRDYESLLEMAGGRSGDEIAQSDVLKIVCLQNGLNFLPGSRYDYCNTGYNLIAIAVERILKKSFSEHLRESIFVPLGLNDTMVVDDYTLPVPCFASSYATTQDGFAKSNLAYGDYGSTGIWSTARDLARWGAFLLSPPAPDAAIVSDMFTPGKLSDGKILGYGWGTIIGTYNGLRTYEHSGVDAGYRAQLLLVSELRIAIAIVSNRNDTDSTGLSYAVLDKITAKSVAPSPVVPTVDDAQRFSGDYQLQFGPVLHVRSQGGFVYAHLDGQGETQLRPSGDNAFEVSTLKAELEFSQPNEDGLFERVLITLFGAEEYLGVRKGKAASPSSDILEKAPGEYYSPELQTVLTAITSGGGLILRHRKLADMRLTPIGGDRFVITGSGPYGEISFTRSGGDGVDGFKASGARALNINFRRT